jgi:hypothetical protein
VVPPPADRPDLHAETAEEMLPQIVHLPCYPEIPDRELRRMAREVRASVQPIPGEARTSSGKRAVLNAG